MSPKFKGFVSAQSGWVRSILTRSAFKYTVRGTAPTAKNQAIWRRLPPPACAASPSDGGREKCEQRAALLTSTPRIKIIDLPDRLISPDPSDQFARSAGVENSHPKTTVTSCPAHGVAAMCEQAISSNSMKLPPLTLSACR